MQALKVVGLNRLSSTRLQIDDELAAYDLPMPWCMEVDQLSTLLGLVKHWGYTAVVPSLLDAHRHGLASLPIVDPAISRDFYLVKRPDTTLSPHAALLVALLEADLARGFQIP